MKIILPPKIVAYEQDWQIRIEKHAKLQSSGGCHDPLTRSIFISPTVLKATRKDVLFHEMMHMVEYYWGFDLGQHPVLRDLELVELMEEGIMQILRDNKITLP